MASKRFALADAQFSDEFRIVLNEVARYLKIDAYFATTCYTVEGIPCKKEDADSTAIYVYADTTMRGTRQLTYTEYSDIAQEIYEIYNGPIPAILNPGYVPA